MNSLITSPACRPVIPFDLNKVVSEGYDIVTRSGLKVEFKYACQNTVVVGVHTKHGVMNLEYGQEGYFHGKEFTNELDLFLVENSNLELRFVNLYSDGTFTHYASEEAAMAMRDYKQIVSIATPTLMDKRFF